MNYKTLEGIKINIRMYRSEDCEEIIELFYNTVHSVNAKEKDKC